MIEANLYEFAEICIKSGKPSKEFSGCDVCKTRRNWGMLVLAPRDAAAIDVANMRAIIRHVDTHFVQGQDFELTHYSHPLLGYVRGLAFRALDEHGKPTDITRYLFNALAQLAEYPVLDEEVYLEVVDEHLHDMSYQDLALLWREYRETPVPASKEDMLTDADFRSLIEQEL